MVKSVEKWVAEDGTEFTDRDSAVIYEEYVSTRFLVKQFLRDETDRNGMVDLDAVLDYIKTNRYARELFQSYIAMAERQHTHTYSN